MLLKILIVKPSEDGETEIPQGWEILGRSFDRGDWSILLKQETTTASKGAKLPEENDE